MLDLRFDVLAQRVTSCMVDHAFSVSLEGGLHLRVETDLLFTDATGSVHEVTPEEDPTTCGPALSLVRARARRVEVSPDGVLEMTFMDGESIVAAPLERYEAWTLTARDGVMVICLPGGGLATWGPLVRPAITSS